MKGWLKENWFLVFMTICLCLAVYATYLLWNHYQSLALPLPPEKVGRTELGATGDFFGGILNPIYAFLGLMMILISLYQNQRELRLSREEFRDSNLALQAQASTLEQQRFEDTFFSLLEQHNSLLNKINEKEFLIENGNTRTIESDCTMLKDNIFGGMYMLDPDSFKNLKEAKASLFTSGISINQYFRVLYQMLKFTATNCPYSTVRGDEFTAEKLLKTPCSNGEKLYTNMIRSFLTEENYLMLAVNCYCEDSSDIFSPYKALVERYSFLEHIPVKSKFIQNTAIMESILSHYSPLAFGSNPDYARYRLEQEQTISTITSRRSANAATVPHPEKQEKENSVSMNDHKTSEIINPAHLAAYELEVGAIANEITNFNANLYLMEKIFNFPWDLILDDYGPFWEYVEKALFDSVILSIWKLCIDTDSEGLTLGKLRNKIIKDYIKAEFKDEFIDKLKSADYDKNMAALQGVYTEIRHNYVAHFNFKKATTPSPEEIATRQLDLKQLLGTRDLMNTMYQVLSLDRYAYLPVQYYPDSMNVAVGGTPGTDIDKLLDLLAKNSEAVNMPERQPEYWPIFKESHSTEEIECLLRLRRKFEMPAA